MKHPSPAVGHMCKEKGEKRSLVVLLHLKLICFFLKCSLNKQDRASYVIHPENTLFFFIILLSYFFSLLLSISLNKCLDHLNGSQTLHLRRKWDTVREISDSLLFCFDLHTFGSSSLGGRRWGCKQSSYISTIIFFFLFSPVQPSKKGREKAMLAIPVLQCRV